MSTEGPILDLQGIGKRYGRRWAVGGFSLRIDGGELVALVGANGGGKTTTLRMIGGLTAPDRGSGRVLGRDIAIPARADRGRIGFMTQRISLYPELSLRDNLAFRARIHGLGAGAVAAAIESHRLTRHADTRVASLSIGWARRAQFAATLIAAPALLLLDEPTAGLDPVTREDIWAQLVALAAAGCAIVVATHDLAEVEHAGRLVHFDDGRVDAPMTPDSLRARAGAPTLAAAVIALARQSAQ